MELKTNVHAEDGKQELIITRHFDLPVELLFKAYTIPELVEQWMGNKVLKMDNHAHGGWQFEVHDPAGKVVFSATGSIHDIVPNQKITRTFQIENSPFDAQLEFLEFEPLTDTTSLFTMHIIYRSAALRDQALQMGMGRGMAMAHNRLQNIMNNLK
ncbi:MAG TPA: SRPBCC domain-containing protein [Saprospiraceae bacterium]|nr:SRPBCC domain-containing protein [Saprospiraceae bacterium]